MSSLCNYAAPDRLRGRVKANVGVVQFLRIRGFMSGWGAEILWISDGHGITARRIRPNRSWVLCLVHPLAPVPKHISVLPPSKPLVCVVKCASRPVARFAAPCHHLPMTRPERTRRSSVQKRSIRSCDINICVPRRCSPREFFLVW